MKLIRFGELGKERPGLITEDATRLGFRLRGGL